MILNPNTHANTGTLFKSFVLLFVLFLQAGSLFSQNINVDAPPSVEVNVTRVSLNFMSEAAGTSITWSIPDAQIMYESPNKSTVEVVFNTAGTKIIQAWGYSFSTGNVYGIVSVEVMSVQPVYVSGQVRQWAGGVLANNWVDATEIGGSGGSRSVQTFYDGTYNFYVPKGTSWQVKPRSSNNCYNAFYPKIFNNVQSTVTADFFRFNRIYEVLRPNNRTASIRILQGSGETAYFNYRVRFTSQEDNIQTICIEGSGWLNFIAPQGEIITDVYIVDCLMQCSAYGF